MTERESPFEAGDRVRIRSDHSAFDGSIATVLAAHKGLGYWLLVEATQGGEMWFADYEVEPAT